MEGLLKHLRLRFKPYYNWNTFNTTIHKQLNFKGGIVLNLIITGIPSIPQRLIYLRRRYQSFKPYYNWNTFNTEKWFLEQKQQRKGFKPYYNWITFNTEFTKEIEEIMFAF